MKTLAIIAMILLSAGYAAARDDNEAVFRIKAAKNASSLDDVITQTGFGWKLNGQVGIVTALHGVVGRTSITAVGENKRLEFLDLRITHADIANDLAFISSSRLGAELKSVLEPAENDDDEELNVTGYPLGIKVQLKSQLVNLMKEDLLYLYELFPDDTFRDHNNHLSHRKSPSITTQVLALEAELEPGHSGAPLINGSGRVAGVCIGGIAGTEISFAIPIHRMYLQSAGDNEEIEETLDRLSREDVGKVLLAFDLSKENAPLYPELKIVVEPDYSLFIIKNVGAPMYNATAEAHAIVYLYGNDCMMDGFVYTRPIYYTYEISAGRTFPMDDARTISFSTQFGPDFDRARAWFGQLKNAVGQINDRCLNSVTLQHLIKVKYDSETNINNRRYFLAEITYQDYIDLAERHRVSHNSEIKTDYLDPDRWRRNIKPGRTAGRIDFWEVSAENIDRAKRYLTEMSGGPAPPAPPAPPANLRIVPN